MISSSFEDLELEIDLMHFEPQKRFRWQKMKWVLVTKGDIKFLDFLGDRL